MGLTALDLFLGTCSGAQDNFFIKRSAAQNQITPPRCDGVLRLWATGTLVHNPKNNEEDKKEAQPEMEKSNEDKKEAQPEMEKNNVEDKKEAQPEMEKNSEEDKKEAQPEMEKKDDEGKEEKKEGEAANPAKTDKKAGNEEGKLTKDRAAAAYQTCVYI